MCHSWWRVFKRRFHFLFFCSDLWTRFVKASSRVCFYVLGVLVAASVIFVSIPLTIFATVFFCICGQNNMWMLSYLPKAFDVVAFFALLISLILIGLPFNRERCVLDCKTWGQLLVNKYQSYLSFLMQPQYVNSLIPCLTLSSFKVVWFCFNFLLLLLLILLKDGKLLYNTLFSVTFINFKRVCGQE